MENRLSMMRIHGRQEYFNCGKSTPNHENLPFPKYDNLTWFYKVKRSVQKDAGMCFIHLLPCLGTVSFSSTIHCCLVFS